MDNINPFPKRHILESSKVKELSDHNFKLDENGGEFSKRVENTVAIAELARYKHILFFPQFVQKPCTADT